MTNEAEDKQAEGDIDIAVVMTTANGVSWRGILRAGGQFESVEVAHEEVLSSMKKLFGGTAIMEEWCELWLRDSRRVERETEPIKVEVEQ